MQVSPARRAHRYPAFAGEQDIRVFRKRRKMPPLLMVAILFAALMLRIAVPQGWMPAQMADGWRIVLCSGSGPMEMSGMPAAMAMPGMKHMPAGHDHGTAEHPCAFSALALALAEPVAPSLPEPMVAATAWLLALGRIVTLGHGLAAPPPPSTGPPPIA
jgi:hypothetical protein